MEQCCKSLHIDARVPAKHNDCFGEATALVAWHRQQRQSRATELEETNMTRPYFRASRRKTKVNLSEALERRFLGYAAGAGAVAAGLVSFSQPAEAEIVFVPTHVSLHNGQNFPIHNKSTTQITFTDNKYIITRSMCPPPINL